MDLVVRAAHMPIPGETILGSDFRTIPGGKGANQAVAAARLGAEVTMVGRVGVDTFGQTLLHDLISEGIDVSYLAMDDRASSGVAMITVDNQGQNSIVVAPGANHNLTPAEIYHAFSRINEVDIVILQLEIPLDCVETAAILSHQRGARTILNPAPAQPLPTGLLSSIDILIPNESETGLLTGLPVHEISQVESAGQKLFDQGAHCVVITMGNRGVWVMPDKRQNGIHLPAHSVEVIDTTAAGDAFVAGLAVGLGEDLPLMEAVKLGNAAGALTVTRLGAQPSLPTRAEVNEFLIGVV
jgi:ribokinase